MEQAPQMEQAPMDGGLAQLPIPERQYAGGGIVAFDNGGMATDEEDETDDAAAKNQAVFKSIMDDKQGRSVINKLWSSLKNSYVGEKAARHIQPTEDTPTASTGKRGTHPYEDMVLAEAKKLGVDFIIDLVQKQRLLSQ